MEAGGDAKKRGPLARRCRELRKLDPGTNLLYKNIHVVGTALVCAEIRECFSVLSMKPTVKKQVGLKGYKHLLMSYKAEGCRQNYKVKNDVNKAGNPHTD